MSNEQQHEVKKNWTPIVLAVFYVASLCGLFFVVWGTTSTTTTPTVPITPTTPTSPQTSFCTSFDYTRWSHCLKDGTKMRNMTAVYPEGCTLADNTPVLERQSCQYTPVYVPPDFLAKMSNQIVQSGGGISANYISGTSGDSTIRANWIISDDNQLLISALTINRQTGEATENILLRDTNSDFRPDIFSRNGTDWSNISSQPQTYQTQLITVWAEDMAYFGAYLADFY
ncbi:MAG: hypothetical protein UT20_C0024G0005 [Candidatus Levybacteria bacterium GW2011_GWA1_39_11]|nr:MAG: hypothetical protein UT20_C0024G0005 [Candidatus Levybacteria bacterium GW2011_GWA1_39_11]